MRREDIFAAIDAERERQAEKWNGHHDFGSGDCSSSLVEMPVKMTVLGEEFGEACRAVLDRDDQQLRVELVQMCAVGVAILEGMGE